MKKLFILPLLLILLSGCGHAFLPEPTKENVSIADIMGNWQYEINPGLYKGISTNDGIINIEFVPDGTFKQEVLLAKTSNAIIQTGHWRLQKADIHLSDVLMEVPEQDGISWKPINQIWWVIDGHQEGVSLSIFGGNNPDPDQYREFKKIANK